MGSALRRMVLVRHGETVGQSSIRYHGSTDVALDDRGRAQMERVGAALAAEVFDRVYTSALQRTIVAARLIAPTHVPQVVPGFNEINFGAWEGLTREEIAARDPELFDQWRARGHDFMYPDGDAVPAFRRRVADAWRALHPGAPERVLIVAHKGVIATIVAEVLQLSSHERAAWPIDLASIHVLAATSRGWTAERMNDVRHMDALR
jgi:broad specificity phosphatase PhoE